MRVLVVRACRWCSTASSRAEASSINARALDVAIVAECAAPREDGVMTITIHPDHGEASAKAQIEALAQSPVTARLKRAALAIRERAVPYSYDPSDCEVVELTLHSVYSSAYVQCKCGAVFYESGPGNGTIDATMKAHDAVCTARRQQG
jgi:hypothetical protein